MTFRDRQRFNPFSPKTNNRLDTNTLYAVVNSHNTR